MVNITLFRTKPPFHCWDFDKRKQNKYSFFTIKFCLNTIYSVKCFLLLRRHHRARIWDHTVALNTTKVSYTCSSMALGSASPFRSTPLCRPGAAAPLRTLAKRLPSALVRMCPGMRRSAAMWETLDDRRGSDYLASYMNHRLQWRSNGRILWHN